MNEATLAVTTDGDHVSIGLAGDVDLANAYELEARLAAAIPNHATAVDLDLGRVTYLDSAGLQIVFALTVKLRRLQIDLRILAPEHTAARHAIDMAGMGSIARIEPV